MVFSCRSNQTITLYIFRRKFRIKLIEKKSISGNTIIASYFSLSFFFSLIASFLQLRWAKLRRVFLRLSKLISAKPIVQRVRLSVEDKLKILKMIEFEKISCRKISEIFSDKFNLEVSKSAVPNVWRDRAN